MVGIEYLRKKLEAKQKGVMLRYKYYDMKNYAQDFGISTPPNLRYWSSTVGWCAKGVDSLADRLVFRGFRDDTFELNKLYEMNNADILFDSAVLSALISSCCFIYISPDENGFPRMQVIDGGNATGIINPITGLLDEGYAVLTRDDSGKPEIEAYFTPYRTTVYINGNPSNNAGFDHNVAHPLLVPIIHRPDATRPFGRSVISHACMSLTGSALRTIKRGEISAEFYSFPQKWVSGLSEESELERWSASMSAMLAITKDEDGDTPVFGQFQQQDMTPHLDQLKTFASMFAGETGLTLYDMGFPSDSPSSAESIKASHENLRLAARKAQRTFGSGFLNAGYVAACLRDQTDYNKRAFCNIKPVWEPVFEADSAALSLIGDGAIKLNQAIPGYINSETLRDLTGIVGGENHA